MGIVAKLLPEFSETLAHINIDVANFPLVTLLSYLFEDTALANTLHAVKIDDRST